MSGTSKLDRIIYPEIYKTEYILTFPGLNDELKNLLEESGYKDEFTRKYRKSLKFLDNLKRNCTQQRLFERLTNTTYELYSIRLIGEKNIRILFTFISINNKEHSILLYGFQEKNTKSKSKDSYASSIKIAEDRIYMLKN